MAAAVGLENDQVGARIYGEISTYGLQAVGSALMPQKSLLLGSEP